MKRYFFFALLFPPAFMNLLLVQAHPDNLARFLLAGYVVAIVPALLVALTDELLERRSLGIRATGCMLTALISAPLFLATPSLQAAPIGVFAAIVALICFVAFNRRPRKKLLQLPSPDHFRRTAGEDGSEALSSGAAAS